MLPSFSEVLQKTGSFNQHTKFLEIQKSQHWKSTKDALSLMLFTVKTGKAKELGKKQICVLAFASV